MHCTESNRKGYEETEERPVEVGHQSVEQESTNDFVVNVFANKIVPINVVGGESD